MTPAYPIGVIDDPMEMGATFSVMPQHERTELRAGQPVTVWNQTAPGGPMAKFRGEITEISKTQGSFIVLEERIDKAWPQQLHPMGRGNPVYIALPGSFECDMSRRVECPEEYALMVQLAKDHEEMTGIKPSSTMAVGIVYRAQNENLNGCDGDCWDGDCQDEPPAGLGTNLG